VRRRRIECASGVLCGTHSAQPHPPSRLAQPTLPPPLTGIPSLSLRPSKPNQHRSLSVSTPPLPRSGSDCAPQHMAETSTASCSGSSSSSSSGSALGSGRRQAARSRRRRRAAAHRHAAQSGSGCSSPVVSPAASLQRHQRARTLPRHRHPPPPRHRQVRPSAVRL